MVKGYNQVQVQLMDDQYQVNVPHKELALVYKESAMVWDYNQFQVQLMDDQYQVKVILKESALAH